MEVTRRWRGQDEDKVEVMEEMKKVEMKKVEMKKVEMKKVKMNKVEKMDEVDEMEVVRCKGG